MIFEQACSNIEEKQSVSKLHKMQMIKMQQKELAKKGYITDDRYKFMKGFLR